MKKIMLFALAATMLAACAKENEPVVPQPPTEEGTPVRISFGGSDRFTRAFFDDTAVAEPWEKAVTSMTVYAFDPDGIQVMRKAFSAADIAAMQTYFVVPGAMEGRTLTFYALANQEKYVRVMEEEDFYTTIENACYDYNDTDFNVVTAEAVREHGFSMSGMATATMKTDGSVNDVSITLKRLVAKIAVRIDIDPTFTERYHGGSVEVTRMYMRNCANAAPLMLRNYDSRFGSGTFSTMHYPEEVDGAWCGLFYIYGQGAPAYLPEDKPELEIIMRFSQDGVNLSGDGNDISVTYRVALEGSGGGTIHRNGYYRVSGTITDFDALHIRSVIEVSDWEAPTTEEIGNITINEQ